MARTTRLFVVMMALILCSGTAHALEGSTLTGVVTATDPPGTPIAGAVVVLIRNDDRVVAVTDATGAYTARDLRNGMHRLLAHAPGYAVGIVVDVEVTASGNDVQDVVLTSSGARFATLPVFGGQIAALATGGQSGVFYAATSVIPQVFRSVDYGGTWNPVTPATDDTTLGLVDGNAAARLATSGYPGDVAVEVNGTVWFSTDFGVTWRAVGNPGGSFPPGGNVELLWGHGDETNVLLRISGTTTLRADMDAETPAFAEQSPSYVASAGDRVAVGAVYDNAWIAVVDAAGTLNVYDLADLTFTSVSTLSGLPSPPTFVEFGGLLGEEGQPPDAVLVYASGSNTAVMATKAGGPTFTSVSAATTVPGSCGAGPGAVGALSPPSSGLTGAGTISQCWVTKVATNPLTFVPLLGINNNTGFVFDPFYSATNLVALSGDGARGIVKSASTTADIPVFPAGVNAGAGVDMGSGGVAVDGLTVPVVKDTAYGPAGASQIATALSASGGGLTVASDDGGATFRTVVAKGGNAVDWWQGASGSWLVVGHGGAGTIASAVAGWTSSAPPLPIANLFGLDAATLGASGAAEQFAVTAIEGVSGSDVVFIGGGTNVDQTGTGGTVFRGVLQTGPLVTNGTVIADPLLGARAVRALAHCAAIDVDTDVLFVATGDANTGSVVRIVGASGAAPAVTEVAFGARVNDVRAHCASGRVYAATGTNGGGPSGALLASTDGGVTFAAVPVAGPGLPPSLNVQVVAVDPNDGAHVLIAGNSEGFILESSDAGVSWTVVNSPTTPGGRSFLSEGVGDLELPPATSPLQRSGTTPRALVGTGGGLFATNVAAGGGGGCTSVQQCDDQQACTTDACVAGVCTYDPIPGVGGVDCELDELLPVMLCADGTLQRQITKTMSRMGSLLTKYASATRPKKARKLVRKLQKQLTAVGRKVVRSNGADDACKTAITAQLDVVRARVDAL